MIRKDNSEKMDIKLYKWYRLENGKLRKEEIYMEEIANDIIKVKYIGFLNCKEPIKYLTLNQAFNEIGKRFEEKFSLLEMGDFKIRNDKKGGKL